MFCHCAGVSSGLFHQLRIIMAWVVMGRYVMDKDKLKAKELRQVREIGASSKAKLG
jgi:hypothetical protein